MRIEIEIPKEFEGHFEQDRFEDSLHRLCADAHLIAGKYDKEVAIMLIKAFKESEPAYSVEKVIEELDDYTMWRKLLIYNLTPRDVGIIEKAIEIVRNGGKE